MTFARLSAVYGLSYSEIKDVMPLAAINAYISAIPAVLAEKRLIAADGACTPHMKNPRSILRVWRRQAYGDLNEAKPASPGMLKLAGIGVKHVKKREPR